MLRPGVETTGTCHQVLVLVPIADDYNQIK